MELEQRAMDNRAPWNEIWGNRRKLRCRARWNHQVMGLDMRLEVVVVRVPNNGRPGLIKSLWIIYERGGMI